MKNKTLTGLHESHEPIRLDMLRYLWPDKKDRPANFKRKRKEPRIPMDLSIALLITVGFAIALIAWMSVKIDWNTSMISELTDKVSAIETQLEEITVPEIEVSLPVYPDPVSSDEQQGMYIPPEASAFKTWMDYRKIGDRSSEQWKLQQIAETNNLGFRTYDGCYIVAVGSFYSSNRIGKRLVITFDTGSSIQVIVGDVKRDEDVINGQYHADNGNLIEFIIDKRVMDPDVLITGDVSSLGLTGKVVEILEVG